MKVNGLEISIEELEKQLDAEKERLGKKPTTYNCGVFNVIVSDKQQNGLAKVTIKPNHGAVYVWLPSGKYYNEYASIAQLIQVLQNL